jgi:CRP-like cAMP-binding protein
MGERLLALGLFIRPAALPARELSRLARLSREREMAAGAQLAVLGQPVRVVHFVVSGKMALSRDGVDFLVPDAPHTVGFLPLAAGIPFPFDARALEPLHSLEVDAEVLAELLEDDFDFFLGILRQGASELLTRWRSVPAMVTDQREQPPPPPASLGAAERLLALRNTDLFRRCPVDGLAAFAKLLQEEQLLPAHPFTTEPGELAVVVHGRGTVEGALPSPLLTPGRVLGAVEGLAESSHPFTLHADTPLRLLRGTIPDLLDTLEDHHAMARRLLSELAGLLVGSPV